MNSPKQEQSLHEALCAIAGIGSMMARADPDAPGLIARRALERYALAHPAAQNVEPTGWLIEHSGQLTPGIHVGQISWLYVVQAFEGHGARELGYTLDAGKALRFARKEDAEAVLKMYLGASPPDWYAAPFSVTEHSWPGAQNVETASSQSTVAGLTPPLAASSNADESTSERPPIAPETASSPVALTDEQDSNDVRYALMDWVVERWRAEVQNRPLVNIHRRSLDDTWRQMLRKLGGDDVAQLGPTHDTLLATPNTPPPQEPTCIK